MELYKITFSPTGGTQKAADLLVESWETQPIPVDLTDPNAHFSEYPCTGEDVAVIAVPSYAGRVPAPAIQRLTAMQGNGARAVLVCVYGNRAYEDTLVELEDAAVQAGFQVVAGVAAIAEHSIAHQYAAGRPDSQDRQQLQDFGRNIWAKLQSGDNSQPTLPGNRPYKKAGGVSMVPKPSKVCNHCGLCARQCPVQAIDPADPSRTDKELCISCMRCVAVCPQGVRKVNPVMLTAAQVALKKVCSDRKEGELFL